MKIRQLQIERFGAWRDVGVTLAPHGLTILYGPNETGKSTLVRFIRSVLYGFQPQDELGSGARPRGVGCAGEIVVNAENDELVIRRASGVGGQAELRRRTPLTGDSTPTLARLLGGVSRDVYERVFAVGLGELQELATLHGDEVSQFIYQLSLGDDGERILEGLRQSQAKRHALVGTGGRHGEVQHWQRVLSDIDTQLAASADAATRHAALAQEHAEVSERIDEQQWRQRGLREQLRGHAFLERVWGPWQRQRQLEQKRDALPEVSEFPEDGARRLSEIDAATVDLRRERARLRETRQRLHRDLRQLAVDPEFQQHAPEIRALLPAGESLRDLESRLPALKSSAEAARRQLDERLRQLGPGWSEARLEKIDAGPAAAVRLFRQADRYRTAARSRARCIRAYRRSSTLLQQRQSELAALLRPYAGAGVRDAQQRVREELTNLDELRRLETRHQAGERLLADLRAQDAEAARRRELPTHFYPALAVLGVSGLGLALAGGWRFSTGGSAHAGLVGAIFVLLGICCGGLTWTIKQRLESDDSDGSGLHRRQAELQSELQELERDMQRLMEPAGEVPEIEFDDELRIAGRDGVGDASDDEEIAERFETLTEDLAKLGSAGLRESVVLEHRQRMANMRQRIRLLQRSVSQSRRDWCTALKEAGLDESVRVAGAFEMWQSAHEARRQQLVLRDAQAAVQHAEDTVREIGTRVAAVARQVNGDQGAGRPSEILARWRGQLEALSANDARRSALRQELRAVRSAQQTVRRTLRQQAIARRDLLSVAGAMNRREFLKLDAAWRGRRALQVQLEAAADELSQAAASEPELAIVEDDLLRFDGAANHDAIDTIETELADLQADLQADHERLGRVQQELESLESDHRPIDLRFERAQAEHELQRVVQQLSAVELATRGLDDLRARLEAERQPETLQTAGRYLQHLTAGKYRRVWAPLGEQALIVDDERKQSFRVDQLSSGTREQLFLSIRLALIDEFLRHGVELPIVLDDLFVNFDQQRTEAAVRTVIDYAADGRQLLLLTCHQHLVRLFEAAGVTTVRLPEQGDVQDRRRVG